MHISSINFSDYTLDTDYSDRGVYSRRVYYDATNRKFIKVWNEDFFYRSYFEQAYRDGKFFPSTAVIDDIITDDENRILGYITPQGGRMTFETLDKHKYNDLIERVSQASINSGFVYMDLVVPNLIDYENRYYLIDLEATIPAQEVPNIPQYKFILSFGDYHYRKSICDLLQTRDEKITVLRQHTFHKKPIQFGTANGRVFLEREFLPSLDGRVLYVGVNYYTDFYSQLVQWPNGFETLDVSENVIEHGSPYTHYVGDLRDFSPPEYLYSHVCFFGILGHPDDWEIVRQKEEIIKCIEKLDSLVLPGGTLLLGPATVTLPNEFWDEIYDGLVNKRYDTLTRRKIDINYIYHGRSRV